MLRLAELPLTVGTAGHVDHGKTALVGELTGIDTDKLAAEKARGLSIELGYAPLELPSGRRVSVIDVPGHERFIRTMVSGATGIDCFLMVIAATDGAMPQTREHARILDALGIHAGIVVITKTDLADPARAIADAAKLMPGTPVHACSPHFGKRRAEVLAALDSVAAPLVSRAAAGGPAVMHIDRVFTIAGPGTVVTGTLSSGHVGRGDMLTIHPRGLAARVRGLQIHGVAVQSAPAGQRLAVNLARVPVQAIERGDVLATVGAVEPAFVIDAELDDAFAPGGEPMPRILHVHHGTRATSARARPLAGLRAIQLRCRQPLMVRPGEPLLLRDAAGRVTLGGATVTGHTPPGTRAGATRRPSDVPARSPVPRGEVGGVAERATAGVGVLASCGDASGPLSARAVALATRFVEEGTRARADRELEDDERQLLPALCERGLVVRLAHGRHASPDALTAARSALTTILAEKGCVTLPELRDRLSVSRNQAKAFLDYFDSIALTRRRPDDTRVLRRTRVP